MVIVAIDAALRRGAVGDVVLRVRQVQDEVMEQWVCEAVARGARAVVDVVPERVEVNRDRLLLVLHAVYDHPAGSTGQRAVGDA